jgi:hypothetical protein
LVIVRWTIGIVSSITKLSESDDRYCEGCCAKLSDDGINVVAHGGPTTQRGDAGIGVEQKAYSAGASPLDNLAS